MASLTECPLCLDDFIQPRQLVCSHTYCTDCLEDLIRTCSSGGFYCPECRMYQQVPRGGVQGFPSNRYVLEIQNIKAHGPASLYKEELCDRHTLPLSVFCVQCQLQLCPTCALTDVRHKQHTIIELGEKIDQIKKDIIAIKKDGIAKQSTLSEEMQKMTEIIDEINNTASKTLADIDETKGKVLERYRRAMEEVQKQAETFKMNVIETQQSQLKLMQEKYGEKQADRENIKECCALIDQMALIDSPREILAGYKMVQPVSGATFAKENAEGNQGVWYKVVSFLENKDLEIRSDVIGYTLTDGKRIKPLHVSAEKLPMEKLNAQHDNSMKICMNPLYKGGKHGRRMRSVSAEHYKSWEVNGWCIASGDKDMLYISGEGMLKAFDRTGNMKRKVATEGRGLVAMTGEHSQYIIMVTQNGLELYHDSGRLVFSLNIPHFAPSYAGICQGGRDLVFVLNGKTTSSMGTEIMECVINGEKIQLSEKRMEIPLMYITGICSVYHNNKYLVVVTSNFENAILSLAYETGQVVWEMRKVEFEGKIIQPQGICTDSVPGSRIQTQQSTGDVQNMTTWGATCSDNFTTRGTTADGATVDNGCCHLYVTDPANMRVLVLTPEGRVLKQIVTTPAPCWYVTYLPNLHKLAVTDNNCMVHVYDVLYGESTESLKKAY